MPIRSKKVNIPLSNKIPDDIRKEELFRHFKSEKDQLNGVQILKNKVFVKGPKRIDILFD
jgi:hypothetical protein